MQGIGFIIIASLCWALDGPIRYPLIQSGVSASRIVFTEHLYLSLLFFGVMLFTGRRSLSKFKHLRLNEVISFIGIGAFGSAIATLCFTRAFSYLNPSHVILLQKLQPVVAILLAHFLLKEKLDKHFSIWALVCLFGGVLIGHKEIFQGIREIYQTGSMVTSSDGYLGIGLSLIAVVGWGSATVFGKKLSGIGLSPLEIMAGRYFMGFLALLPLPFSGVVELDMNPMIWGKIFLLVLLSGILGMYLYYQGLKRLSARLTSLTEMFFPFLAVVVNWILLGIGLDLLQITGAIILLLGSLTIKNKHY